MPEFHYAESAVMSTTTTSTGRITNLKKTQIPITWKMIVDVLKSELGVNDPSELNELGKRWARGHTKYGQLHTNDGRDWMAEAKEEERDRLMYMAFHYIEQKHNTHDTTGTNGQ